MPVELDDAIKAKSAEFRIATMKLSPTDLFSVLPVCFPMTHQIDPDVMLGIARYPIDEWEAKKGSRASPPSRGLSCASRSPTKT